MARELSGILSRLISLGESFSDIQKEQIVGITLAQLNQAHLLESPVASPVFGNAVSRRQLIKAVGIAALVGLPVVSTIIAPTAARASTCLASGQGCSTSAQCCSGLCSTGTCV